jgi:hypothetical protein
MRPWLRHALLVAVTVGAVAAGCRQVIGIGDLSYGPGGNAGGSGGSSTTGSTGSTGTGGAGTTSSASSSGTGGGGACPGLHPGGGTCEYAPGHACGCAATEKCSVVDAKTGKAGCVPAGTTPIFAPCGADPECAAGAYCSASSGVCLLLCTSKAGCAGGSCVEALDESGSSPIPGLDVCTANCDPITAAPCGPLVTCSYSTVHGELDCVASKGVLEGGNCSFANDCAPGLVCVGNACRRWCTPVGDTLTCSAGSLCAGFSNLNVMHAGQTYGYCN